MEREGNTSSIASRTNPTQSSALSGSSAAFEESEGALSVGSSAVAQESAGAHAGDVGDSDGDDMNPNANLNPEASDELLWSNIEPDPGTPSKRLALHL